MKKKNVVLEQIRKYKWGYLFGIILETKYTYGHDQDFYKLCEELDVKPLILSLIHISEPTRH